LYTFEYRPVTLSEAPAKALSAKKFVDQYFDKTRR